MRDSQQGGGLLKTRKRDALSRGTWSASRWVHCAELEPSIRVREDFNPVPQIHSLAARSSKHGANKAGFRTLNQKIFQVKPRSTSTVRMPIRGVLKTPAHFHSFDLRMG